MISIIYAQDLSGVIGNNGDLPWRHPIDMKYFKGMTHRKTVVMGRKTFESFPSGPLPKRRNIILTRDKDYRASGAIVVHSVAQAMALFSPIEETMIIGGAEVFLRFFSSVDRVYRSIIQREYEGDTYFPITDWTGWELIPHASHTWKPTRPVIGHLLPSVRFDVLERSR